MLLLAACGFGQPSARIPDRVIGLSTSLPLIWGESGDIRGRLADKAPPHWAVALLARHGRVVPIDTLAGTGGTLPLPRDAVLVLAQPHPLMPEESVALDVWVRAGGRLLLFVDPMLTAASDFALGDPRGPQRVAMLSPILRHWGLDLQFDPEQPQGERMVEYRGAALPVNLAGRFATGRTARCSIESAGVIADCRIGRGQVLAVADTAVFDGDDAGRSHVLEALVAQISR